MRARQARVQAVAVTTLRDSWDGSGRCTIHGMDQEDVAVYIMMEVLPIRNQHGIEVCSSPFFGAHVVHNLPSHPDCE